MKLSDEQIEEILESSRVSIIEGLKKDLVSSMQSSIDYAAREEVVNFTVKWVRENILPEIVKSLTEQRKGLLEAAVRSSEEITESFAKSLAETMKKNMGSEWNRKEIFKAMFSL